MVITIDGPAASGKSTIAEMLAFLLQIYYVNSGFFYRALAYLFLNNGYTLKQLNNLRINDINYYGDPKKLTYNYSAGDGPQISFEANNITAFLKDPLIDVASSMISTNQYVRNQIHILQHTIAREHSLVIEGRDAGSVVFPNANYKFFLTASLKTRANRWINQQAEKGYLYSYEDAVKHIKKRDDRDKKRKIAPLRIPHGAEIIDTTALSIDETIQLIRSKIFKDEK